jgi:hypothetical protein
MGRTTYYLDEIRAEVAPSKETLEAVRERRDTVLGLAETFEGVRGKFRSGSVAHGTANEDTDGDGGIILDRRKYGALGPDGEDEDPEAIVEQVRSHVRAGIKNDYPEAGFKLTKRAITVTFNEPLSDGSDPQVDLIVSLERKDAPGLWIPNLDAPRWDASDPQKHTDLLRALPKGLRRTRAHVIRLAKTWNVRRPRRLLCSFNIEALALAGIDEELDLGEALALFFEYAAGDLADRLTPDPADVSGPIKVEDRDLAVKRLGEAAGHLRSAIDNDTDDDIVRTHLADVFPEFVDPPKGASSKAALAAGLTSGLGVSAVKGTLSTSGGGRSVKANTRAYGGAEEVQR